jgi:hypothetical protein
MAWAASSGHVARVLLVASMTGASYLSFFAYKHDGFGDPRSLDLRLSGNDAAPEQYRTGIYALAHAMVVHLHVAPSMAFAVIDLLCGIAAVLLLFSVLERGRIYAAAQRTLQWIGAASAVLLVLWFMAWLLWLGKPETLPATALVTASLWLWDPAGSLRWPARSILLLILTVLLASFRADVACLLNAGVLGYNLTQKERLSLPRGGAAIIAAMGTLLAAAAQWWLVRMAYPQASYGRVKLFQLWPNVIHATRWPPFVIFMLPLGWLVVTGVRRGLPRDAAGRAMLAGAGLYLALWVTIGKIDEVRIFIPFALALVPITVETAMERIAAEGAAM